ncbi:hypothetical protein MUK42_34549 [Musa troglodytarum]|uniref:Uncharacterized protein n=1 Tax=Musa troglodytarum TaxID=320322 RepID=A0A9E7J9A9_9LILI|nr:hypothetical protein MUK42_34549 [Musa troglodytarum]
MVCQTRKILHCTVIIKLSVPKGLLLVLSIYKNIIIGTAK